MHAHISICISMSIDLYIEKHKLLLTSPNLHWIHSFFFFHFYDCHARQWKTRFLLSSIYLLIWSIFLILTNLPLLTSLNAEPIVTSFRLHTSLRVAAASLYSRLFHHCFPTPLSVPFHGWSYLVHVLTRHSDTASSQNGCCHTWPHFMALRLKNSRHKGGGE